MRERSGLRRAGAGRQRQHDGHAAGGILCKEVGDAEAGRRARQRHISPGGARRARSAASAAFVSLPQQPRELAEQLAAAAERSAQFAVEVVGAVRRRRQRAAQPRRRNDV